MAKHVEREQTDQMTELTNQATELTADEMERVSGGFLKVNLTETLTTSISMGSGGEPPKPPPTK